MESIWLSGYTDPVTADDLGAVFGLNVVVNKNNNNKRKDKGDYILIKTRTKCTFYEFLIL